MDQFGVTCGDAGNVGHCHLGSFSCILSRGQVVGFVSTSLEVNHPAKINGKVVATQIFFLNFHPKIEGRCPS